MAKPKANTEKVSVFFPIEILKRLKDEAEKKGTSVSGIVRMIVMEHFSEGKN